jgi:ATP-dependent Clp protease ATP-binding subunit ClpC
MASEEFFSRNLTSLAAKGELPKVFGRDRVIEQVVAILLQEGKASVVLTGEPGVGKTSIVEGLALQIVAGKVPEKLRTVVIKELDANALVAGTIYHGQFEGNVKEFLDYLRANQNVILFVDELHSLMGISSDVNRQSPFVNQLKPYLARGEIRVIGASTNREFNAMSIKDGAFARRFQTVDVPEPTREEAVTIVRQVALDLASRKKVTLGPSVVEAAIDLSVRLVPDRRLPDKAIDLIKGCISQKEIQRQAESSKTSGYVQRMLDLIDRELEALEKQDWVGAAKLTEEWFLQKGGLFLTLTVADLERAINEKIGAINIDDPVVVKKIRGLEQELQKEVVGQARAIHSVCDALKRMLVLGRSVRPIGSFLFLGPTGVGKTELCRVVASNLWGQGSLLQYNMSEFGTREDASKLIGAPPGYHGYEEGGRLVRDVATKPNSVVLFDEIEKADHDIHKLLLQILEEGKLRDGTGKTCSFSQALVMMTSNVGADWISLIPADELAKSYDQMYLRVLEQLKQAFLPEIINRIDEIVIFSPLTFAEIDQILDLLLAKENERLRQNQKPALELTAAARSYVVQRGYDPTMGARPLRRALQDIVLTKLADYILENTPHGSLNLKNTLVVDFQCSEVVIRSKEATRP